jgi:hypothetical protein
MAQRADVDNVVLKSKRWSIDEATLMATQELRTERLRPQLPGGNACIGLSEIFSAARTARRDFALS